MNKYYRILDKILATGKTQTNKKGNIQYLLNEQLSLTPADLLDIFEGHNIARKKLRSELQLFMQGERNVEKYREAGINWWDYCGSILVNSYPTYFEKLPPLIAKINRELLKRLQASGIRLEDARYIDLYSDYTRMLDQGEKVSYAVAVLSEKYSVSERKVYALVKRFQSDCKTLAV